MQQLNPKNTSFWATVRSHISIARPDHWFKNVFVLPGAITAYGLDPANVESGLFSRFLIGMASVCLIASSNYTLNEILDAKSDLAHPRKKMRPIPSGAILPGPAYVQWIILCFAVMTFARYVSPWFTLTMATLWIMGLIYNVNPVRTKDVPYLDVLSEAINNPIRMLAGWFIVDNTTVAPGSMLLSYWMIGCFFMAVKRLAEFNSLADPLKAAEYRKSFKYYTQERLLVSIMFYGSAAMLFLGAFVMRYRLEEILAFPFVALVMAVYLRLGLRENSPAQYPESLYKEPLLMASVSLCAFMAIALMLVDLPWLESWMTPTAPVRQAYP